MENIHFEVRVRRVNYPFPEYLLLLKKIINRNLERLNHFTSRLIKGALLDKCPIFFLETINYFDKEPF